MTFQQLKYAIGVAEHRSFNEAAKNLNVSQPSLSASVKDLEREMGVTIFSRTARGVTVTADGAEFLGYARQVLEQTDLLEEKYRGSHPRKKAFSVSTQHYAFAVNAFVQVVRERGEDEYEFTLRETRTHEIIEDVRSLRSEIGVLYLSAFNEKVLNRLFREYALGFTALFTAKPHIFVSASHPLAKKRKVKLEDLAPYPCLSFEQGEHNSFYFSEEILSTLYKPKSVTVSDRATLFNLLIGINGYTISTGVLTEDLNGKAIVAVPLDIAEEITVGCVTRKGAPLSAIGERYVEALSSYLPKKGRSHASSANHS